jgi:hypothetical protein
MCGALNDDTAAKAILEHFAFFGGEATNQEIRCFTGIEDRHLVKRLLADAGLEKKGQHRHSKYTLKH